MIVLHQEVEKKGTFQITVSDLGLHHIQERVNDIFSDFVADNDADDYAPTPDQQKELDQFHSIFQEGYDWKTLFDRIPRKANGTFAKNRQVIIAEGHSFRWVDEDSYGERGPQLRLKTISDTEAVLEFHSTAMIYKY